MSKEIDPIAAAYAVRRRKQSRESLAPEVQKDVRRIERFSEAKIISHARNVEAPQLRMQPATPIRRIHTW